MEKRPGFLRKFSKEHASEERQHTADALFSKRKEASEIRTVREARQESLSDQVEISHREREGLSAEVFDLVKRLETLGTDLDEINKGGLFRKLGDFFTTKKLRADIAIGEHTQDELVAKIKDLHEQGEMTEKDLIAVQSESEEKPEMQEAKDTIDSFYKGLEGEWEKAPYTKEEAVELFSEDHLASLSLEEYKTLVNRFPGDMVAHVTRQGIRDHTGHLWHSAGFEDFGNGFKDMLEDGRLRSALGHTIEQDFKEEKIAQYFGDTRKEALDTLQAMADLEPGDSGGYEDRMAIHFAANEVADRFYGAEKNNEIFLAYPSMMVATQYDFQGTLTEGGSGQWNDQWVWTKEAEGIDINAGIVFIPADTQVDKITGSRYQIDTEGKPIENEDYKQALQRVAESPHAKEVAAKVREVTESVPKDMIEFLDEKLQPVRDMMVEKFNITDRRLQESLFSGFGAGPIEDLVFNKETGDKAGDTNRLETTIEEILRNHGILYELSRDSINSQKYWEQYFSENPDQLPNKIVYYDGGDPTAALKDWQLYYGKSTPYEKEHHLGFPENKTGGDRRVSSLESALKGKDRFFPLAKDAIERHFGSAEKEESLQEEAVGV